MYKSVNADGKGETQGRPHRRAFSGFGVGEKVKIDKPSQVGPGS